MTDLNNTDTAATSNKKAGKNKAPVENTRADAARSLANAETWAQNHAAEMNTSPDYDREQHGEFKTWAAKLDADPSKKNDRPGNYAGPILYANESAAVQQIGPRSTIIHDLTARPFTPEQIGQIATAQGKDTFVRINYNEGAELAETLSPEQIAELEQKRADRATREAAREGKGAERDDASNDTPEKAPKRPNPEMQKLIALKNEILGGETVPTEKNPAGERTNLYFGKMPEGRPVNPYSGVVRHVTDKHLLQQLNPTTLVVHNLKDMDRPIKVGDDLKIAYLANGKVYANERDPELEKQRAALSKDDLAARQASYQKISASLKATYEGQDIRVHGANAQTGEYWGKVQDTTSHHVAQKTGANTFIIHDKDRLQGDKVSKGIDYEIKYDAGRGNVVDRVQRKEQTRSQLQDQSQQQTR